MRIGYKNAWILTMDDAFTEYRSGYLVMEGHLIVEVGAMDQFEEKKADDWIDAQGGILLPGFVNAHTHCGMIPFRSLGDDCPDRLRRFLFPLEQEVVDEPLIAKSTAYAIAEMQLAGVTAMCDMYYFEDAVAKVAKEMKMCSLVGETIIDMKTPDSRNTDDALAYTQAFVDKWKGDELVQPLIAPHAPNTNTEEVMRAILEFAKENQVPITLHVSEMTYEMDYFRKTYNQTPIEFLESLGFFEVPVILAHGILMTESDIEILAKYPTVSVVHCIGANTKSAKGVAPIRSLLDHGVTVGLGTDGPSSGNTLDVALATRGGAKALGLDEEVGTLEIGKKADIVLVETSSVNMFPVHDAYAALVYSANASNVQDVWINGERVVDNKKLVNVSLEALKRELKVEMATFEERAVELSNQLSFK